jgi:hypothetical protein
MVAAERMICTSDSIWVVSAVAWVTSWSLAMTCSRPGLMEIVAVAVYMRGLSAAAAYATANTASAAGAMIIQRRRAMPIARDTISRWSSPDSGALCGSPCAPSVVPILHQSS